MTSAFQLLPSASPTGADHPDGSAVGLLLTRSRHSPTGPELVLIIKNRYAVLTRRFRCRPLKDRNPCSSCPLMLAWRAGDRRPSEIISSVGHGPVVAGPLRGILATSRCRVDRRARLNDPGNTFSYLHSFGALAIFLVGGKSESGIWFSRNFLGIQSPVGKLQIPGEPRQAGAQNNSDRLERQ